MSFPPADVALSRLKEAQEIVLTGAKELTSKSNYNYKIFTKSGGSKQAEKDFEEFRLPNARYFALTGKVGYHCSSMACISLLFY